MQPRSACEEASTEIQRYRENSEKKEDEYLFVFVGIYVCRKLLLAMVLGPYKKMRHRETKKEQRMFVFLGMYECNKLLIAMVLGPLVLWCLDRWSFGAWTGGPFALPCYGAWMNDGYRGVPSNAMGH